MCFFFGGVDSWTNDGKKNMNIKPGLVCLIAIVGVYVRFQVCAVCVCVCVSLEQCCDYNDFDFTIYFAF